MIRASPTVDTRLTQDLIDERSTPAAIRPPSTNDTGFPHSRHTTFAGPDRQTIHTCINSPTSTNDAGIEVQWPASRYSGQKTFAEPDRQTIHISTTRHPSQRSEHQGTVDKRLSQDLIDKRSTTTSIGFGQQVIRASRYSRKTTFAGPDRQTIHTCIN